MVNVVVLTSFPTMERQGSGELSAVRDVLGVDNVVELVADVPSGSLVFPRFRSIPFGDLLEREVVASGSSLINSFAAHRRVADSFSWVGLLDGSDGRKALTPSQFRLEDIPSLPEGEWFVKGETNSLKSLWLEACYAPTTKDLVRVTGRVLSDNVTGSQSVVIKPFQKYRQLCVSATGQPVFHERRVFVLNGKVISEGFYWSSFVDEVGEVAYDRAAFEDVVKQAVDRTVSVAPFLVIDFAEFEDGSWGVVELNDGCMSGLSENDPLTLWSNVLKNVE